MSDKYERWQPAQSGLQILQQGGLGAFVKGSGQLKDDQTDRLQEAATAGFPDLAASDALPFISIERGLPRVAGEADGPLAERLRTAWDTWILAGSVTGLLEALSRGGFPFAGTLYIVEEWGKAATLSGSTAVFSNLAVRRDTGRPGWWFDGGDVLNTRFALLFTADHASVDPTSVNGAASIAGINKIVDTWKFAEGTFYGTFVVLAGTHFLGWATTQTLGASGNLGGNSMRTVYPDGTYRILGP